MSDMLQLVVSLHTIQLLSGTLGLAYSINPNTQLKNGSASDRFQHHLRFGQLKSVAGAPVL